MCPSGVLTYSITVRHAVAISLGPISLRYVQIADTIYIALVVQLLGHTFARVMGDPFQVGDGTGRGGRS